MPKKQQNITLNDLHQAITKLSADSATKKDLDSLRISTKKDLDSLRISTKKDLDSLRISTKKDLTRLELSTQGLTQGFRGLKRNIKGLRKDTKKDIEHLGIMMQKHFASKQDLQDMEHEILESTKSTRDETLSFKDHIATRVSDLAQEQAMDKAGHDRMQNSIDNHESRIKGLEQTQPQAFA